MSVTVESRPAPLGSAKFSDPLITADGARRASVGLAGIETLWFNTGTLCNLTCENCYIDSSPRNDSLVYLSAAEVRGYLDEIANLKLATGEIGFTGGEPFMNPDIAGMLADCLERSFRVLVLSNGMLPMMKLSQKLEDLNRRHGGRLVIRISIDHYTSDRHQDERGEHSWLPAMEGLEWLARQGFAVHVAGRTRWGEDEASLRAGYAHLFAKHGIPIDADDPVRLVLFPEMAAALDIPEITEKCWDILGVSPGAMMCATSRMVIRRKEMSHAVVVPCTLLPYGGAFEMGRNLADAAGPVALNHPHCARFCVLGGGACSRS